MPISPERQTQLKQLVSDHLYIVPKDYEEALFFVASLKAAIHWQHGDLFHAHEVAATVDTVAIAERPLGRNVVRFTNRPAA